MTVTAAAGGSTANGILLRVTVLNGVAATQTGATAVLSQNSTLGAQTAITTTVTGSMVYGALCIGTSVALSANGVTTLTDNDEDTTNGNYYLGTCHTTSATGTPGSITVGSSAVTTSQPTGVALAEILPNGTINVDSSTPAATFTMISTSAITASFTPPPGSLLVAEVVANNAGGTTTMAVSGAGLVWTPLAESHASGQNYCGIWIAVAAPTSPNDPVITATAGGATFQGIALQVLALTGAAPVASQTTGGTAAQSGTAAHQAAVTTTVTGSMVYGALINDASNTAWTANGLTTIIDDIADPTNNARYGICRATSATGTPGSTTIGASAPSSAGAIALLEILPAGTIVQDASSPALASTLTAITVACGSFTPPGGSLLVAIVSANSNTGVTTMTVSGGGLNWTEKFKSNVANTGYTGIWIADVPAVAVGLQPQPGSPVWRRRFQRPQQLPPPAGFRQPLQGYNAVVAADSPIGWWRLDESTGSTANDSSGHGLTGAATAVTFGTASAPAGMPQTCGSFNGTTSFIDIPGWMGPGGTGTSCSFEGWANLNGNSPGNGRIVCNGNPQSPSGGFGLLVNTAGTAPDFDMYSTGAGTLPTTGGSVAATGWAHIVGTYDGGTTRLYLNGAQVATVPGFPNAILTGTTDVTIGTIPSVGGWWHGFLCQVAVYNTVLSAARVQVHYLAGAGVSPVGLLPQPGSPVWRRRFQRVQQLPSTAGVVAGNASPTAGLASATGTAFNPVAQVTGIDQTGALGTGAAFNPVVQVTALPAAALATGAAQQAIAVVTGLPSAALATGTAQQAIAVVTGLPATALATGTAYLPGWGPGTIPALAAGAAQQAIAQVTALPTAAFATGAAFNPVAQVTALPAAALAAGTAQQAIAAVTALPSAALATGAAQQAVAQVTALPATALATGTAYLPGWGPGTIPALAAGAAQQAIAAVTALDPTGALAIGTAYSATVSTVTFVAVGLLPQPGSPAWRRRFVPAQQLSPASPAAGAVTVTAGAALATGAAQQAIAQVTALPSAALATGTAYLPGWGPGSVPALATGTALQAVAAVTALPSAALAIGTAYNPGVTTGGDASANPTAALATGTAYGSLALVTAIPATAAGAGAAYLGGWGPGTIGAAAAGAAKQPVVQVTAIDQTGALAAGTAQQPAAGVTVFTSLASASGSAYLAGWGPGTILATASAASIGAALSLVANAQAASALAAALNASGVGAAAIVKGSSLAAVTEGAGMKATVTEGAGMAAAVTEGAGMAAAVTEGAGTTGTVMPGGSSQAGVS